MTASPRFHRAAAATRRNLVALEIPAVRENVPHVRHLITAFAGAHGANERTRQNIALAVSEAVSNAVVHGYKDRTPGLISVIADVEDGALEVVITDQGNGMAADVESTGLGLGLGLIARVASRFAIRDRDSDGTELWIRFEL